VFLEKERVFSANCPAVSTGFGGETSSPRVSSGQTDFLNRLHLSSGIALKSKWFFVFGLVGFFFTLLHIAARNLLTPRRQVAEGVRCWKGSSSGEARGVSSAVTAFHAASLPIKAKRSDRQGS